MKHLLTIFLSILLGLSGFTQSAEQNDNDGAWFGKKPKYRNKEYKQHRNLKDEIGRKQGTWVLFSTYGNLVYKTEYKDGVRHGIHEAYYPSTGKMRESMEYFNGRRDGPYATYFYTGEIRKEGEYALNKKVGKWTYYHRTTGEIKSEGLYVKGKRDGLWKFFNSKGTQIKTIMYTNGVGVNPNAPKKEAPKKNTPVKKGGKPVTKKTVPTKK